MRTVTEKDFRSPEFRDAKPEDYEFREDGKVVRKDRWKTTILDIRSAFRLRTRDGFELGDMVKELVEETQYIDDWVDIQDFDAIADVHSNFDIKMVCGSILKNVSMLVNHTYSYFYWNGVEIDHNMVDMWRRSDQPKQNDCTTETDV